VQQLHTFGDVPFPFVLGGISSQRISRLERKIMREGIDWKKDIEMKCYLAAGLAALQQCRWHRCYCRCSFYFEQARLQCWYHSPHVMRVADVVNEAVYSLDYVLHSTPDCSYYFEQACLQCWYHSPRVIRIADVVDESVYSSDCVLRSTPDNHTLQR